MDKRVFRGKLEGHVVKGPGSVEVLKMSVQYLKKEGRSTRMLATVTK